MLIELKTISIKLPHGAAQAKFILNLAEKFCIAVNARNHRGELSPTAAFFVLLFAFAADPQKAAKLYDELDKLGEGERRQYKRESNRAKGNRTKREKRSG